MGLAEQTIVFCGVSFMGESAKILNPGKTVLMPDLSADCQMAHMADAGTIRRMREKYEDLAVVCYINSTAELKKYSDVCVTSANAVEIVKALPNRNIFFIPDKNLAHYVAEQVPEKHFVFNEGYCPVHEELQLRELAEAKAMHPDAEVLSHPECREEVLKESDYIGSTSGSSSMPPGVPAGSLSSVRKKGCGGSWKRTIRERSFILRRQSRCAGI